MKARSAILGLVINPFLERSETKELYNLSEVTQVVTARILSQKTLNSIARTQRNKDGIEDVIFPRFKCSLKSRIGGMISGGGEISRQT